MCGLMEEGLRDHGRTTKCMAEDFSLGQINGNTKGNITMTKSMVTECSTGPTVVATKVSGQRVNRMEKALITLQKAK